MISLQEKLYVELFVSLLGTGTSCGVDYNWFFQAMISQITHNINKPEYTSLMKADFSQSTSVDRIVNNIMLMYSFKEYFEYRMMLMCGIPGVVMLGSEDDWLSLLEKLVKVEELLKPLEDVLQLGDWFKSSQAVLQNLLETYRGNPDKDWWSRIVVEEPFGSGARKKSFTKGSLQSRNNNYYILGFDPPSVIIIFYSF